MNDDGFSLSNSNDLSGKYMVDFKRKGGCARLFYKQIKMLKRSLDIFNDTTLDSGEA